MGFTEYFILTLLFLTVCFILWDALLRKDEYSYPLNKIDYVDHSNPFREKVSFKLDGKKTQGYRIKNTRLSNSIGPAYTYYDDSGFHIDNTIHNIVLLDILNSNENNHNEQLSTSQVYHGHDIQSHNSIDYADTLKSYESHTYESHSYDSGSSSYDSGGSGSFD